MDLINIVFFLIYLSVLWTMSEALFVLLRRFMEKRWHKRKSKTWSKMIQYFVLSIGFYLGVQYVLDISMDEIIAGLGIASIIVAFISKKVLENVIAGFQINLEKKVEVEDWVELSKHGWKAPVKVTDISLTKTTLRDTDGTEFILPNSDISDSQFINYTKTGYAELDIELPLPLDTDMKELEATVLPIVRAHSNVFPNVRYEAALSHSGLTPKAVRRLLKKNIELTKLEPKVVMISVKDKYLIFNVRCYVAQVNHVLQVKSDLTWSIWNELRAKGKTL